MGVEVTADVCHVGAVTLTARYSALPVCLNGRGHP